MMTDRKHDNQKEDNDLRDLLGRLDNLIASWAEVRLWKPPFDHDEFRPRLDTTWRWHAPALRDLDAQVVQARTLIAELVVNGVRVRADVARTIRYLDVLDPDDEGSER